MNAVVKPLARSRTLEEAREDFTSDVSEAQLALPLDDLPTRTREIVEGYLTTMNLATPELVMGALLPIASYAACLEVELLHPFNLKPIVSALAVLLSAPTGGGKSYVSKQIQEPIKLAAEALVDRVATQAESLDSDIDVAVDFTSVFPVVTEGTMKGLARHASEFHPALFLNADAGNFLDGYSMREEEQALVSFLCACWSGEWASSKRADAKDDITVASPLMPTMLATQPSVFQRFYANSTAKGTGLHARFLPIISKRKTDGAIPTPEDLMAILEGQKKTYSEPPAAVREFEQRLFQTVLTYLGSGEPKRSVGIEDSYGTKLMLARWHSTFLSQRQRGELAENGMYARLDEHMLRLAAVFAWLEGASTITEEILRASIVWAEHFLAQYVSLQGVRMVATKHVAAYELLAGLVAYAKKKGSQSFAVRSYRDTMTASKRLNIGELQPLLWSLHENGFINLQGITSAGSITLGTEMDVLTSE